MPLCPPAMVITACLLPLKPQPLLLILPSGCLSPGYGNGLGAGAFPGLGAQPGEDAWGSALGFREGEELESESVGERVGFCGEDKGLSLSPGLGGSMKPTNEGEPCPGPSWHFPAISIPAPSVCLNLPNPWLTVPTSVSPGFGSRNGLGVSAFPGAGALPGKGGSEQWPGTR